MSMITDKLSRGTRGAPGHRTKAWARNLAVLALLATGLTVFAVSGPSALKAPPAGGTSAPSSPPVTVCGNASLLSGPASAPPGAISIPAGDNSSAFAGSLVANKTYWFAPGTHTLGSGEFAQIDAADNDTLVGGPGAILDGQDKNDFAIAGSGTNVTIEYLTIQNFTAPQSQGAVNQNLSSGWVVENSTIQNNPNGAGVMVDSNGVLNDDCLTKNGQYGFQTYSGSDSVPVTNLTITNNEISFNDTRNYDTNGTGTCGCTGGAKFWNDLGATVTGNYIHDNQSVGLWMDTNNTGFNVSDNYFSHNWDVALMYEISYNVSITDNTFVDNGWIAGPNNPGTGAIEINNAGSDPNVHGAYDTESVVSGNVLTDNWGGVDIYDDADRFCGTQSDNTSSDYCTLDDPSTYSVSSCTAHDTASATSSQNPDYYDNCRWKSQNILVTDNTFNLTPSNVGPQCTAAKGCGFIGLYSEWGTYPPYNGFAVPLSLVNHQNNVFAHNTYNGPFVFDSEYQGDPVSWAQWSGGYTDPNSNAAITPQDAGSTFNGSVTNPTSTTTTVAPTTTKPRRPGPRRPRRPGPRPPPPTTTTPTTTTTTAPPTTTTTRPVSTPTGTTSTTTPPTTTTTTTAPPTTTTTTTIPPTTTTTAPPATTPPATAPAATATTQPATGPVRSTGLTRGGGYWIAHFDGEVDPRGDAPNLGVHAPTLNAPITHIVSTPDGRGYWLVASFGGIFPFGDAKSYGSTSGMHLNRPIVGMAATPDGGGYWLVASDGGIFSFGDARFDGSTGGLHLNEPIVGMAATPDGGGYWLVASDGGIFAFGDARFDGSTGGLHLNEPIVSMATTPQGGGYWLVSSDGGIFSFGDARFDGSTGGIHLNKPIVGMAPTPRGSGYWLVASDGAIFAFGNARFFGSAGPLQAPIVGMATMTRTSMPQAPARHRMRR